MQLEPTLSHDNFCILWQTPAAQSLLRLESTLQRLRMNHQHLQVGCNFQSMTTPMRKVHTCHCKIYGHYFVSDSSNGAVGDAGGDAKGHQPLGVSKLDSAAV